MINVRRPVMIPNAGLFDIFKEDPEQKARKEEEFKRQQEVLQRRRSGSWKKDVDQRRAVVKRYNSDADFKKKVDEEKRAREPKEEDAPLGRIIVPLAPFNIPKYDLGERFDLKGPYVDQGWVDEDADFMKSLRNLFRRKGGKKERE